MNKYELTDLSASSAVGESSTDKKMSGGCYVRATTGVIIALLAVIMSLGVGLIVHFAENRSLDCNINQPGAPSAQQVKGVGGGGSTAPCPTTSPCPKCDKGEAQTTSLLTSQATPGPQFVQEDVRLPGSVVPTHYTLKIQPEMYNNDVSTFYFHGSVVIHVQCKEATDTITLHARMLNITKGSVVFSQISGTGPSPKFVSYTEDKDRDFLLVHLSGKTIPGNTYTLTMEFRGPLKDDLYGLYLSSYMSGDKTVYCAVTQFESTNARKAFPCFDDPAMKATFQLTIVRKKHLMSLSNMPIQHKVEKADNYVEDVYETSEKMSTYLLAYVVGTFSSLTAQTSHNLTYGAWARPESVGQAKFALDVGTQVIAYYEDYFGVGFPLPKQDMIAIPDFGPGAMENWGLITYRESYMLYEQGTTSERAKQRIAAVIAHELSHQWFGDLVTMEWWDDIWLNEGFATFVEHLGTDKLFPEWKMWFGDLVTMEWWDDIWLNEGFARFVQYLGTDKLFSDWKMFEQFVTDAIHVAFDADSLVTSHPVYVPIRSPKDIGEVFDNISYEKGASIIRMMRFILGEETFRKGITRYLKQHEYGNANHTDLWKALAQQSVADGSNLDVSGILDTWTLQMNYPVVMVTKNRDQLVIRQDRFLSNPDSLDPMTYTSTFGYRWKIPFTFTTSQAADKAAKNTQIHWLNDDRLDIPTTVATDDWVLGNVQQYGYYRVNYEDSNWAALIQQLKTNHKVIWPVNRAQIINDAWSLSRAGQLSTLTALQTLEYLDKELDYVPWRAATRQMAYVDTMLKKSSLYGQYQKFLKAKVADPFQHFGMESTNSSHLDTLTRSAIVQIACSQGLPECILQSKNVFKKWMEKPTQNKITPDIRPTVYCTAVAEGGTKEWDFVYQLYLKETVITEKMALSAALACTRTPWLLSKYLEMSITPSIVRKQDIANVMINIANNPIGQPLAWDFFREHWDFLYKEYGFGLFKKILTGITASLNTEFELSQLNSLKNEHPGLIAQSRAFQQVVEKTQTNIKWMKENTDTLSKWLTSVGVTTQLRVTDVRLPNHLEPVHYELTLKPNMYGDDEEQFNFEGFVKIHMTARATGRNVTLHANKLDIVESSIRFGAASGGPGPKYNNQRQTDKDRQFEIFFLDADVVDGTDYTIEMNFTGPLIGDLAGLYLSKYDSNNVTKYIATTQFEATDARKSFPCFDEPQLKATFAVKLIRKSHMKSISNMPIIKQENIADNFVVDTHNSSAKMSTYLLAFVVSEFEYTSNSTKRGVQYRAWARPEYINQTKIALDAGVRILSHYEDYFGEDFPLPKQDMIAVPDFSAGAMENWGLIIYRETAMLYEPGVSSQGNLQRVNVVIAHELAHQWFGDLVTMEWWDDLWLNEGFASFVEYMGVDYLHPDWKMFEQFGLELYSVFDVDSLVTSHPIYVPVYNPDEIGEIFDTISYGKGAAVIQMIRFVLGEDTFKFGLQKYLKNRKFSNADHNDLWSAFQQQADKEGKQIKVKDVMDTWILQMNYPVVKVTKSATGKIHIAQHRYLTDKNATDPGKYVSPFGYVWKIPFTYTTQQNANFNVSDKDVIWLENKTKEVEVTYPTGWILGNVGYYGVYRVTYDDENWKALIQQLNTDHKFIHVLNRGQLINDAFALAKAKELSMDIALTTLDYLDREQEYVPWTSASRELGYIRDMLAQTETYGAFQRFMLKKVEDQYARLGLNDTETNHLESYLRSNIVGDACSYGNTDCVNNAKMLFKAFMDHPDDNPISPGVKSTVYCTAVREGGEAEWDFVFQQYRTANVQAEKVRLLSAMACTTPVWMKLRMLRMAMDPSMIRTQDADNIFGYIGSDPEGKSVVWDFFRSNWDEIFKTFGTTAFSMSTIIGGATDSFNTELQLQQLQEFRDAHPDLGTGARTFSQAIERTQANIKWMEENYSIVASWLDKY